MADLLNGFHGGTPETVGAGSVQTLLNKVAVITGAASGIGLACARTLSRRGAHVVAVDLNAKRGDSRGYH